MGFKRSEKRMTGDRGPASARAWRARGIAGEVAGRDRRSISSFALYGFPESHAVSFALIAYASAYLKCYHPAAFYVRPAQQPADGLLPPVTLVKDAQRHGVRVRPVDVTRSGHRCALEEGEVRLGLNYVRGLREDGAKRIEGERALAAVRVAPGLRGPDGAPARRAAEPGRGRGAQRLRPDAEERAVAGGEGRAPEGGVARHSEGLRLDGSRGIRNRPVIPRSFVRVGSEAKP